MYAVGACLIIFGLVIAAWQYAIIHGKEVAEGRVSSLEAFGSSSRLGGSTERLVASFSDRSGVTHQYQANFGLISTGYEVGDRRLANSAAGQNQHRTTSSQLR